MLREYFLKAGNLAFDFASELRQRPDVNVRKIALLGFGLGMIFLSSCSSFIPRAEVTQDRSEPQANLEDDFSPRWEVNEEVYQAMTPGEGRIEIDREALRLTLYNSSNQAVITTDCST